MPICIEVRAGASGVPRAIKKGENLSYLVAKHSAQAISGALLLSTRPATGAGRFHALLIVIYNSADRGADCSLFPRHHLRAIGSSRGRVRPQGGKCAGPASQLGD